MSVHRALFAGGSYRVYRPDGASLPHDKCPMADILRDGIPVIDQEVVIERPDGSRGVALVNIRPLKDAGQSFHLTPCDHVFLVDVLALGNVKKAIDCSSDVTGTATLGKGSTFQMELPTRAQIHKRTP